jgi:hypothetical protein
MTNQEHAKDLDNFVLYVPEIRHRQFRVNEAGKVVLEFEINPVKKLMARLAHRQPVSDIELDELASSAWLSMDVARLQSEKTGDGVDEAVRRMVGFTRYIAKRGWIRFKEVKDI